MFPISNLSLNLWIELFLSCLSVCLSICQSIRAELKDFEKCFGFEKILVFWLGVSHRNYLLLIFVTLKGVILHAL